VTTTPTPQQVGRVQAAIDRILDGDADRYVGAYYNAEARSYPRVPERSVGAAVDLGFVLA